MILLIVKADQDNYQQHNLLILFSCPQNQIAQNSSTTVQTNWHSNRTFHHSYPLLMYVWVPLSLWANSIAFTSLLYLSNPLLANSIHAHKIQPPLNKMGNVAYNDLHKAANFGRSVHR